MAVNNGDGYWFRAKRYGWGWGLPVTWQGWVVMAFFVAALLIAGRLLMPQHPAGFLAVFILDSVVLVLVCRAKGEPTRWGWGS